MTIDVERGEIVNKFIDGFGTTLPPYQWNNGVGIDNNDTTIVHKTKQKLKSKNHKEKHDIQSVGHLNHEVRSINLGNHMQNVNLGGFDYVEKEEILTDRIYETLNSKDEYETQHHKRVCINGGNDKRVLTSVGSNLREMNETGLQIRQKQNLVARHCTKAKEAAFLLTMNRTFRDSTITSSDSFGNGIPSVSQNNNGTISSQLTDYENNFTVIDDTLDDNVFDTLIEHHSNYYENIAYTCASDINDRLVPENNLGSTNYVAPNYGVISNTAYRINRCHHDKTENENLSRIRNIQEESGHNITNVQNVDCKMNKGKQCLENTKEINPLIISNRCDSVQSVSRPINSFDKNGFPNCINKLDVGSRER